MRDQIERCLAAGGIVLFGADTVYGLACDPHDADAVRRLYELKGRSPQQPAAIMFGELATALAAIDDERVRAAAAALLPGPVTLLVPNPRGLFPLACGPDPDTLGLRVPPRPLVAGAVLQSSANRSGGPEARRLQDVDPAIRAGADLVLDAGALPGVASSVVDLRPLARGGRFALLREGVLTAAQIELALRSR